MASERVLRQGLLYGKLPGMRDWTMYSIQISHTHLHILDEYGRKNIRSLQIDSSDLAGEDTKNKKEFRFYLLRSGDGKYTFRCDSPGDKSCWISQLQSIIHKDLDRDTLSPPPDHHHSGGKSTVLATPLPAAPSPRASVISTDSGFGASEGGEVKRERRGGFRSAPVSGDGQFVRSAGEASKSGDGVCGRPPVKVIDERGSEMSYEKCKWFWGTASRQEAERRLLSEGKIGNFVVRINASGHYVMTYWRKDGIHHHKILNHGTIYRFEKSAVEAEGESLVDLLDTYMKANSTKAKPMEPFGGALFEMYNYAWTPPSFDMNLLEERLKEQKRLREEAAKASRRPHQYTPVDIGESSSSSSREDSGSGSFTELATTTKARTKTLPPTPKKKSLTEGKLTVSMEEPTPRTKPLPLTPTNKQKKGSALIQELQAKKTKPPPTTKPAPKTKPVPKTKPKPPSKSSQSPAPSHEPPEYANCNFGPSRDTPTQPPEDESLYMNIKPPQAPPTRKARPSAQQPPPPSEYQNIGARVKPRAYK